MDIHAALLYGNRVLRSVSKSFMLDTQLLLARAMQQSNTFLFTHPEKKLTPKQEQIFRMHIERRKKHEPVAMILGIKEFFGLTFHVNRHVLTPRPETEIMVEEVITLLHDSPKRHYTLIDVGTGTGCIPIAILSALSHQDRKRLLTYAIDISKRAVVTAQQNIELHALERNIQLLSGNLLIPYFHHVNTRLKSQKHIIITANLPYLSEKIYDSVDTDIKNFEPQKALLGGTDGLVYYRKLLKHIKRLNCQDLTAFFEIDPSQENAMKRMITSVFPQAQIHTRKDLANRARVLKITFRGTKRRTGVDKRGLDKIK
ncbi:MAG TPA: peptide chain release factor N(5)-glutamine methyltransferase [Patescibacteria group bacterium]|nr:peptide chain release factor N(5)-glutamine methyltransferase [Patescibacteria group bacterium]